MASCSKPSEWREIIRNEALRIGFDACGFARVEEVDVAIATGSGSLPGNRRKWVIWTIMWS